MGLGDFLREKIRRFLHIEPAQSQQITIMQKLDYYGSAARNRLWYRGDSEELSAFFGQLDVSPTVFWKAASTKGMEIRKLHTGIPKLMVKVLANIIAHDYNGLVFKDVPAIESRWNEIAKKNGTKKLLKRTIKKLLITGDGAFKVSFDTNVLSDMPILEYVSGEDVEFVETRGRITEVIFPTTFFYGQRRYLFKERYGCGYIRYELFDENGNQLRPNAIPQTRWADSEGVTFDSGVMLAVPVIFGESEQYECRGESLFEGKSDSFDALDEAWSQWMDALRAGRTKQYIPEDLIPRDPATGRLIKPNAFDNRFIAIGSDMSENGGNRIHNDQPEIPHDSYLATYVTALEQALQGVISPSTIGIDVKKLDNAEAQREKEKTTLYTRGNIIELLNDVIPETVAAVIYADSIWHKQAIVPFEVKVKFGEYANPSFESQIETIAKGKSGRIMSTEAAVDELYGDTKTDTWKKEEVRRIKEEQGVAAMDDPPSLQDDV